MQLKNKSLFISNLVLFSLFLLWNFCQPLVADDLGRAAVDALYKDVLLDSLIYDYKAWTGRLTAQLMVYILFSSSYLTYLVPLINILNSLILVAIFNLLYKIIFNNHYQNFKFWLLTVLYIAYFVAIGTFSQNFLWKTVAIQYAWGLLLLLIIIWQFYLNLINPKKTKWWEVLIYLSAGIFLGFYNEIHVAFVVSLYLATIIAWFIFKNPWHNLLQTRYIIFFVATLISGVISIIAPGNFVRRETYLVDNNIDVYAYGFFSKALFTYVQFFRYGYHVILAMLLVWIGVWAYKNRKTLPKPLVFFITFLVILLNLNILSFIEIAYYSPIAGRMLIFIDSIIFLILFKVFYYKLDTKGINLKWKPTFYGISLALFAYITIAYIYLYQFSFKRQYLIINNKNVGNKNLLVSAYCVNKFLKYPVYFDDITTDKDNLKNRSFADCYNLDSIVAVPCN